MGAYEVSPTGKQSAFSDDEFLAWLDEDSTLALVSESHDRYYAYCVEFGIAGSGATREEAIDDAVNLLMRYLAVSFLEGRPYRDAKKPPPKRIRLRSLYLLARKRFLRQIKPLSRLGGLTSVPTTKLDPQRLAH
jgi:hypothetical protein